MNDSYTAIPLSPIRKVIAARMVESTQTIPHFRLTADIEVDALLKVRKELRERDSQARVSLNDLLVKACAMALMEVPAVNIQWADGEIRQYKSADISIVTALDGGLSTPILRQVDSKTVWDIAREIKVLTARAANNTLRMAEVFGGAFSISNLGMHGIDQFDAIINPPQCAILALGCAKPRLILSSEHEQRIATVLRATLSVDHRALDGVAGAAFLAALQRCVNRPSQWIGDGEGTEGE